MNYEERYNQTIESIKRIYDKADSYGRELMEKEFPELRESEDERIRKEIIAVFKGKISYTSEEDAKKYIAWLEKQGEKSWREEDEKFLVDTMNFLYRAKNQYAQTARLEECIDWLKSLKPQSHWKPTENQISMLLAVIHDGNNANSESCQNVLQSLYNDLKKL